MKQSQLIQLLKIAEIARCRIELLAKHEQGPSNLTGYCGIASRYLQKLANAQGIFPKFICGTFRFYNRIFDKYLTWSGHSWLELNDVIVDITATQFKDVKTKVNRSFGNPVYYSSNSNPHYLKYSDGMEAIRLVESWYEENLGELLTKIEMVSKEQECDKAG
jgi:hypothetical protein